MSHVSCVMSHVGYDRLVDPIPNTTGPAPYKCCDPCALRYARCLPVQFGSCLLHPSLAGVDTFVQEPLLHGHVRDGFHSTLLLVQSRTVHKGPGKLTIRVDSSYDFHYSRLLLMITLPNLFECIPRHPKSIQNIICCCICCTLC